eukprot:CAMPEP_0198367422 /NCGR_PEP_ID=MMETSP1450-20131203/155181_1 /TAXON_ID=753684 ORGANISM="Madagascaria erythrocladiodes, Strain CCMP3234" /NCGR_SAMPLE_ID=MMETSP1450 /ASSEMBLY_ACC=CAM_ASM_001115 /LENGTH=238 /DNA_ID=CAMNT_0044074905 /DNA_START=96 /DNA_END=808 /DNA_ORIENTATION=-
MAQSALAQLHGKPWYKPNFGRQQAEQFLASSPVGTFVIRPSSTPDCLALSQKNANNEIFHARINCCKSHTGVCVGFSIGTDAEVFSTVEALLQRVQPQTQLVPPPTSEQFLASSPVGTFVIRPSSTPDCLALSQKNANNEIFHARINCCKSHTGVCVGFSIGTDAEVFSTVEALLQRVQPQTQLVPPPTSNGGPGGGGGRGMYPAANSWQQQQQGGPGGYRHPSMGAPGGGRGGVNMP